MNRRIVLATRPVGYRKETDFRLEQIPVPEPGPGKLLVQSRYVSVDPYMRSRISGVKSYARPTEIGEVVGGGAVGRVVRSNHPGFSEGEVVEGMLGWQDFAVSDGSGLRKVDPELAP